MIKSRFIFIYVLLLLFFSVFSATTPANSVSSSGSRTAFFVRTINENVYCQSEMVIPANTSLNIVDGAQIINSANCKIVFQGIGLEDPSIDRSVFSGFAPGDITWAGNEYPSMISASLWQSSDLSDRLLSAIAAARGRPTTIKLFPGNFGKPWQLPSGFSLYLTAGRYTSSVDLPDGIHFYLESNTTVYGDGIDKTILQESSRGGRNARMFGPSGFKQGTFAGYNEKINYRDFTIVGHPSQVFYDNGPTTIHLGNCTDCHAVRVKLKDTHAYGIFVGGFRNLGYTARDSSIEYCEFDHVIAQNSGALNGINIRIVHNRYWNLGKLKSDPLSNAVDIEPNAEDEITENIIVCDNEIDGRGAKQYWNGIVVQSGGSKHQINGGEVCRNTILGRDLMQGADTGLLNGIAVAGSYRIKVYGNRVQGGLQSGLYLNNDRELDVRDNTIKSVAPGGIFAARVENVSNSTFTNNTIEKFFPGDDDRFVEMGTSRNNVYSRNKRGGVSLLGGSRETGSK
jgi:hypothetical protein